MLIACEIKSEVYLGSCGLKESLASQKFMPGELGSQDAKKGIRII